MNDADLHEIGQCGIAVQRLHVLSETRMRQVNHMQGARSRCIGSPCIGRRPREYRADQQDDAEQARPPAVGAPPPRLARLDAYCCTVFTMMGVVMMSTEVSSSSVSSCSKLPVKGTATSCTDSAPPRNS